MGDVFDALLKKLKQRTFTLRELEIKIENARFAIQKGSETYENDKRYFREFMSSEWVRLEDVLNTLQSYILIPKRRLNQLFKLIADDVHPLKMRRFVEELLKE